MVFGSLRASVALLFLWLVSALAVDIRGQVKWNDVCPNATALGRAKAVLDSGSSRAGAVTASGEFSLYDVHPGTYVLSIISHDYVFDHLRIDVVKAPDSDYQTVEIRPHIPGTPLDPPSTILLSPPITLSAKKKLEYFTPVQSFNLLGMLSSPMTVMMGFGLIMMIGTPYLLKNMDPEMMEEFKREQAKMAGVQNALASGDLKSGLSAIMSAADEAASASAPSTPGGGKVQQRTAGKGGAKKSRR